VRQDGIGQYLEPALDFLSARDVVSRLVKWGCIGLCVLSFLTLLGVVFFFVAFLFEILFSLISYWIIVIILPLIGLLIVRWDDVPFKFLVDELMFPVLFLSLLVSGGVLIYVTFINALHWRPVISPIDSSV
jgi:hypothetical protein